MVVGARPKECRPSQLLTAGGAPFGLRKARGPGSHARASTAYRCPDENYPSRPINDRTVTRCPVTPEWGIPNAQPGATLRIADGPGAQRNG